MLAELRRRVNELPDDAFESKHGSNGDDPFTPLAAWLRENDQLWSRCRVSFRNWIASK